MRQKDLIYEQPLNELVRACLRLEHLFKRLEIYLTSNHVDLYSQTIVCLIIDLLNLLDRPDLKSKLTKEFNRFISVFLSSSYRGSYKSVDIEPLVSELKQMVYYFLNVPGKIAQPLRENLFLSTIRQYLLSPGGDSCIDAPHYFYWLNQPAEVRKKQIEQWHHAFDKIRESTALLLKIVRGSAETFNLIAEKGFYHESLDSQLSVQLVRVVLPASAVLYPEISAGRHRISIRFVIPDMTHRSAQAPQDVSFQLMKCTI